MNKPFNHVFYPLTFILHPYFYAAFSSRLDVIW